mmetsp:Transcript_38335/g.98718  ORF Transcript_38335/g.98718 Transcript_38335/m.98718 type:complete len:120 (+) Transcript_38335:1138-1497(+)
MTRGNLMKSICLHSSGEKRGEGQSRVKYSKVQIIQLDGKMDSCPAQLFFSPSLTHVNVVDREGRQALIYKYANMERDRKMKEEKRREASSNAFDRLLSHFTSILHPSSLLSFLPFYSLH